MSLPIELEEVAGVAVKDTLRRVGMVLLAILGGSYFANLGTLAGEAVAWRMEHGAWGLDFVELSPWSALVVPLRPLASSWGMLYLPFLIATGFYFVRAQAPGMRSVATFFTIAGFFTVLGRGDPAWFTPGWMSFAPGGTAVVEPGKLRTIIVVIGLLLWAGMSGAVWFLALFRERRNRVLAELHLCGISHENALRREDDRLLEEILQGDGDFGAGSRRTPGQD